jgi:dihydroorotate dehydrogenase (NAD+) catalytic subunit
VPVILNIMGGRPAEFASMARRLDNAQGIWGLELTLPDRATSYETRGIVSAVRGETLLPLWAKLPLFRAEDLADMCLEAGANALTVGLPPLGMSLDLAAKARLLGRLYGRMVKPLALRAVDAVAQRVQAPIIACGGIHTVEDAREFLALGASALQVGSATWVEPGTMAQIVESIGTGQQGESRRTR